jgi:hypothetical protein
VAYAAPSSFPYSWLSNGNFLDYFQSRENPMAWAVPSSFPHSWLSNGDFLNYGQWKRGAIWPVSEHYISARDADGEHLEVPALSKSGTHEKRTHGKS